MWAIAACLKSHEKTIDETIDYTRQRKAFGKPLLDNQVIHFRLAELKTEVELLRSLLYRACEEYIAGNDVTPLATMGKLKAGRLGREIPDACLQYWGGMGFMNETRVSRAYRDRRLTSIGGGERSGSLSSYGCPPIGLRPERAPLAAENRMTSRIVAHSIVMGLA